MILELSDYGYDTTTSLVNSLTEYSLKLWYPIPQPRFIAG